LTIPTSEPTGVGTPAFGFRCDAGGVIGVGHLVRCIALAEELIARGTRVIFLGDLTALPWVRHQLEDRDLPVLPAPQSPQELADLVVDLGLSAVVLDGYHLEPRCGAAIRARGTAVLALVDGDFGAEQEADLYLDQNLGAQRLPGIAPQARMLAGLEYVLLRDVVRDRRPLTMPSDLPSDLSSELSSETPAGSPADPSASTASVPEPSVLAVFGGTDPYDAALTVVPLLLAGGMPVTVTAVAARPEVAEGLQALPTGPGQRVLAVPPVDDLPALVRQVDLVVSASGSSVWELLCLGAPTALVCVTPNQQVGYQEVVGRGLAAPLGALQQLQDDPGARRAASELLTRLLTDSGARRALATKGLAEVDGRGRERVADALLGLAVGRVAQ
jgi:spore coat polysaccharide biosynthesis predicted glycosyltransferase SpsG